MPGARRLFLTLGSLILFYFVFGFYLATFEIKTFKNPNRSNHSLFQDYKGVSHVVTSYSKGSLPPHVILPQASDAHLDFIFFTDINLIDRPYSISGYQGGVFSFSNQKLSYLDSHILVYSQNSDFYFHSMSEANAQLNQHFSRKRNEESHFLAILAHPFKRSHGWIGKYPEGLDGIEVINLRHIWQQVWLQTPGTFFWSLLAYPFNPNLSLLRLIRDPKRELELWDSLNARHKTLGFLGNETTARIFRVSGMNFTFPSYLTSFKFASNHILLKSELTGYMESDRRKIFGAIKKGQFYFAFDSLGDPKGFAAYLKTENKNFLMGTNVKLSGDLKLIVDLPEDIIIPFSVEIYKDGVLFYKSKKLSVSTPLTQSGVYRVVVRIQPKLPLIDKKRWFGWIYSNPFYIR